MMSDLLHIRLAKKSDIPAICALFRETVLTINIRDYTSEQVSVWALQADFDFLWLEKITETHFLLAFMDEELAGFASLTDSCNVEMLYTSKVHQGRGVAKRLITELEAEARHRNAEWLVTDASKTARPVFEKMGFTLVREQQVELRGAVFTNYKLMKDL